MIKNRSKRVSCAYVQPFSWVFEKNTTPNRETRIRWIQVSPAMIHPWIIILALLSICRSGKKVADATVDVNLSELEYLAAHLEPAQCRRLVAALHYESFELPESLDDAVEKLDEDIPCLRLLLHWNAATSEGRGKTHEQVGHRLRQLGHRRLADWLGRTSFNQLSKDLLRAVDEPLPDPITTTTTEQSTLTDDSTDESDDESSDPVVQMILLILLSGLVFGVIFAIGMCIVHRAARCEREETKNSENRRLMSHRF